MLRRTLPLTPRRPRTDTELRHTMCYRQSFTHLVRGCSQPSRRLNHLDVPTETFCLSLVVPDSPQAQVSDYLMKSGHQKKKFPLALRQVPQFSYLCGPSAPSPSRVVNEEDKDNPLVDPEDRINSRNPSFIFFPAKG